LQDELIRHINNDGRMSCFDFGVQFLDTSKMTYWGKTRDASFWIENASVEWSEARSSISHGWQAHPFEEFKAVIGSERSDIFRCHG